MQTTGTISAVETKNTSKGDLYEITVGGQKFSTWREDLANKARGFLSQNVTISYTEKQNQSRDGRWFTNRYLDDVSADGLPQEATRENANTTQQGPITLHNDMPPEREGRITRQAVMKVAYDFVAQMYAAGNEAKLLEARDAAEMIADQLYAQVWKVQGDDTGTQ